MPVVVILTSNIGGQILAEAASQDSVLESSQGISVHEKEKRRQTAVSQVHELVAAQLPPELVNRMDDVVVFESLKREDMGKLVQLQIAEVEAILAHRYEQQMMAMVVLSDEQGCSCQRPP